MSLTCSPAPTHLGFLTVQHESGGYLGGYLVTNIWGRPLEFRLSTAVQPNRVQQILYGHTLAGYVCGELIGKTLVEKTSSAVQLIVTDTHDALTLQRCLAVPVVWAAASGDPRLTGYQEQGAIVQPAQGPRGPLVLAPEKLDELASTRDLLGKLLNLDLTEPFARIREAIAEARKMGVTQRAAG